MVRGLQRKFSEFVESHLGAMAMDRRGVDFDALDRQPVHLVFLIVALRDDGKRHLQMMSSVRALGHDAYLCRKLRGCRKPEPVVRVLREFNATLA